MSTPAPSFVDIPGRLKQAIDHFKEFEWQLLCNLRVACPGIIQSFDAVAQTVKVHLALRENILQNLVPTPIAVPPLINVPILLLGGNGFTVCPPIAAGDECLVIFADMCIDGWWQAGGVQNQLDRRRHDLSDGFALVGVRSQPRKLVNYSTTALQIRSDDGHTVIELGTNEITMTPDNGTTQFKITPGEIDLTAVTVKINGKSYALHEHTGVTTGGGISGPVAP